MQCTHSVSRIIASSPSLDSSRCVTFPFFLFLSSISNVIQPFHYTAFPTRVSFPHMDMRSLFFLCLLYILPVCDMRLCALFCLLLNSGLFLTPPVFVYISCHLSHMFIHYHVYIVYTFLGQSIIFSLLILWAAVDVSPRVSNKTQVDNACDCSLFHSYFISLSYDIRVSPNVYLL